MKRLINTLESTKRCFFSWTKNGKTPLIGAICLSEWFCGEMGKKILCASNDYEQADLMFQAINSMREESPTLSKVTRKNIKGIFFGHPKQKKKKVSLRYRIKEVFVNYQLNGSKRRS